MLLSVVINADTRKGYLNDSSTVGDYGQGSLEGVRSVDFLIEGVINKMSFFRGYECQCILYIDEHEPLPDGLFIKMANYVHAFGNGSRVICKPHNRTKPRWYDHITIEALKWAEGDYIVHFDNDANAFRNNTSTIIENYLKWLDEGYKFVCQPWDGIGDKMFWASTRFFICKKETLNFAEIEANLTTPLRGKHTPCLEHVIAVLAGDESVLYPPRDDDNYIVFSWARYFKGTLKKLNEMPYSKVRLYFETMGIHGANDLIDKQ